MPAPRWALVLFALASCAAPPLGVPPPVVAAASSVEPPAPSPPPVEPVSADTEVTTATGLRFTVPAGWTFSRRNRLVRLSSPEQRAEMAIVEVSSADTAHAAAEALAASGRDSSLAPAGTLAQELRHGWDERRLYWYKLTRPGVSLSTTVVRRGDARAVVVVELAPDTPAPLQRAAVGVVDGLRPVDVSESFAGRPAHALDGVRVDAIKTFLEHAQRTADVPGIAVALVAQGRVVFEGGFGVRERGRPARVGADTLFLAGSIQKPLTSLLLAKLIDEGRFSWTTPVIDLYPELRLGNDDMTRRTQMRHLVCNCTAVPWEGMDLWLEADRMSPRRVFEHIAGWKPTSDLGAEYHYSNLLFAAAGYVAGHVVAPRRELGAAFDQSMQTRVLDPLGMRRTTYDFARAAAGEHATGHVAAFDGFSEPATIDAARTLVPERPAGAGWTTAHEYAQYLLLELSGGLLSDGRRYIAADGLRARREATIRAEEGVDYGLGLFVDRSNCIPVVRHPGANVGYRSVMFFLPEHGVGGVLLANSESAQVILAPFVRRVLEVLFEGRVEAADHLTHEVTARTELVALERAEMTFPADRDATERLARRYVHPTLGALDVRAKGRDTIFDFGETRHRVAVKRGPAGELTFVLVGDQYPAAQFSVGERDGKRTLTMNGSVEQTFVESMAPLQVYRRGIVCTLRRERLRNPRQHFGVTSAAMSRRAFPSRCGEALRNVRSLHAHGAPPSSSSGARVLRER